MSDSFATPWTVAQVGFHRQEYWSVLPFPFPGDLPDPVIETVSSALAGELFSVSYFFTPETPGKPMVADEETNQYNYIGKI